MHIVGVMLLYFMAILSAHADSVLRLSTTTSTADSGLLAVLNAPFEKRYHARIDVIAVGSGKALKLGENGDVDVVLAHAPKAEEELVAAGHAIDRRAVMHNDFVIVGPEPDPAQVRQARTAAEALTKILQAKAGFVSRGDDSGTHKKEQELWAAAGVTPVGAWYLSVGQGMAATLRIAQDKNVYTLTDRGTFVTQQDKLTLRIVSEGDPALFNPYHVMAVNPAKHPSVNYPLAKKYITYLTGKAGQRVIAEFKNAGQQLFFPDVHPRTVGAATGR